MHTSIIIFKRELLNCIDDCIDILGDFKGDSDAAKLIGELCLAKTIVAPMGESTMVNILDELMKCVLPMKDDLKARNVQVIENINSNSHCAEVLSAMDSKTFKAIKAIIKKGTPEDVSVMFDYIDCFVAAGESYRTETKVKAD